MLKTFQEGDTLGTVEGSFATVSEFMKRQRPGALVTANQFAPSQETLTLNGRSDVVKVTTYEPVDEPANEPLGLPTANWNDVPTVGNATPQPEGYIHQPAPASKPKPAPALVPRFVGNRSTDNAPLGLPSNDWSKVGPETSANDPAATQTTNHPKPTANTGQGRTGGPGKPLGLPPSDWNDVK